MRSPKVMRAWTGNKNFFILSYVVVEACIGDCKFQKKISYSNASIKHPPRLSAHVGPFSKYVTGLGGRGVKQNSDKE